MSEKGRERQVIAWQGIRVVVPSHWTIGAIGGDEKSGYLRVDDRVMPRFEVKWEQALKGSDPDKVVSDFLKLLRKGRKGEKAEEVRKGIPLLPERDGVKMTCFSWRGTYRGYGVAWFCRECKRAVIAQVMGKAGTGLRELAQEVLASLEDHPKGDMVPWSVYGLYFEMPKEWRLSEFKFLTGYVMMKFAKGEEKVTVHRWAMADYLLSGGSLSDFLRERGSKSLRKSKLLEEAVEVRGHEGLRAEVERRERPSRLRWLFRRPPKPRLFCVLWHCDKTDKIFAVEGRGWEEAEEQVGRLVRTMRCH